MSSTFASRSTQTVFFAQRLNLARASFFWMKPSFSRLRAEDDVIKDREHLDQLEVLVHHTDLERGRVVGVVYLDLYAVLAYLARLRLVQAEENAHESGLACAVFTEQSVDLALLSCRVMSSLALIPGNSLVICNISITYSGDFPFCHLLSCYHRVRIKNVYYIL